MPNLLVVEDDAAIGSVLESTLRLHGYQVCWRRDGRGALHAATLGDFDLVLLDLGLPDLDGVEVCRRLRAALRRKLSWAAEGPGEVPRIATLRGHGYRLEDPARTVAER